MADVSDVELLRDYNRQGSEEAFAALVRRHINLVYSAAYRHLGSATHAEEITQAVFIILARKAASLRPDTILEGWLYETTRLTTSSFLRGERRRQWREQESYMQSTLQDSPDASTWNQMAPLLDEAMARLGKKDRDAVVLRFFKEKNLREVAAALQVNEAAAQRRVHRAVEKLRRFFSKRGVALSSVVITGAISAHSVQAAPVALAHTVTVAAIAKGAAASSSTLALIKGTLKIMAWTKAKSIVTASVALLFATGTTVVVVEKVNSHGVDDSFWEYKNLAKAPPVLIIRPTRYSESGTTWSADGRLIAHSLDFVQLLMEAYSSRPGIMVLPTNSPAGRFDLMLTLTNDQKGALRRELRKKFGFIARHANIETNVVLLKVKDANLLAEHRSKMGSKQAFKNKAGFLAFSNIPISSIAESFESAFQSPVQVQAGCAGNYDVVFEWGQMPKTASVSRKREQRQQDIRAGLDQIGLELIPATNMIEMLVVERTSDPGGKDTFLEPLVESDYAPQKDSVLQGRWEGTVKMEKTSMQVSLRIAERAENTFRAEAELIEGQRIQKTDIQATSFSFIRPQVIIEFDFASTTFEGNLSDDGKEIKGMVTSAGEVWPLTFKRTIVR